MEIQVAEEGAVYRFMTSFQELANLEDFVPLLFFLFKIGYCLIFYEFQN